MNIFKKVFDWDFFGNKAKEKVKELENNVKLFEKENKEILDVLYKKENNIKPYKNIIYSNSIITVIFNDGSVISETKPVEVVELIKNCTDESQIIALLKVEEVKPQVDNNQEEVNNIQKFAEYKEEVLELLGEDFNCQNEQFFYKNISLPINSLILNSLIEHKKNNNIDEYNALVNFFLWLALNPIEAARQDAMRFVKENDIPLDANGLLITFRSVEVVKNIDTTLNDFITEQFFKKKRHKKSPNNYSVYSSDDFEGYNVIKTHKICETKFQDRNHNVVGNLNELYINLSNNKDVYYTDDYSKKKKIVFGDIYKEDEDKIDLNNLESCGAGLHSGSVSFGSYKSFGSVGAICLLNPSKIRSVPVSDSNKLRSSELFMVCTTDFSNYEELVNSKELLNFSDIYAKESTEELELALQNKSFESLSCQEEVPVINLLDLKQITQSLKNKIVNF